MYIWKFVDVEVEWTDGDTSSVSYDVVAKDYHRAIQKMESLALNKSRGYTDDNGVRIAPKKILRFESLTCGEWVDA